MSARLAWSLFPRTPFPACSQLGHEGNLCLRYGRQMQSRKNGSPSSSHGWGFVARPATDSPFLDPPLVSNATDLSDKEHQLLLQDIKVRGHEKWPGSTPSLWGVQLALSPFTPIFPFPLPLLWSLKLQHQMQRQEACREGLTSCHICRRSKPCNKSECWFKRRIAF